MTKTPVANQNNPHIHAHWFLREGKKTVEEQMFVVKQLGLMVPTVESVVTEVRSIFEFVEYEVHYASYKDGGTEYIRFEGTLIESSMKLTMDVFSCYCVPLNEDQEPPF